MLGKLLKKNKSTDIIGGKPAKVSKADGMEKAAYITLVNHPDKPSVKLEKKITIGSEVGDLIVDDPAISPRHCSIFMNKGILSVMDHSSAQGTFINKKQLDPGKIFILSSKDKIRVGKYEAKLEWLDVPTSATRVIVPDEMSNEHFEDVTATRTTSVLNRAAADLEEEVATVKEVMDEEIPQFQEMQLGADIPDLPEMEEEEEDFEEEINLGDTDVEEEYLDQSVLPVKVLEKHLDQNKKREAKLAKEIEKETKLELEKNIRDEDGEDLATEYEVTASGIQIKRGEDGALSIGRMEEEIPSPGVQLSRSKIAAAAAARKKDKKKPVKAKGKGSKKSKVISNRGDSSSFLTRLFAMFNDVLLCMIIFEVFYVYTDFKVIYDSLPTDIWGAIKPYFNEYVLPLFNEFVLPHYKTLVKDFAFIDEAIKTVVEYEKLTEVLCFLTFLFAFRIVFGLIFSVSLGQLLVGMRASGKFVWKRLKYPIREIIGVLTFPLFFILDFPALIKKRTFKEVVTFSQYITPRPKLTFISALITPVILLIIFSISPAFKGLEILAPVNVTINVKPIRKWEYKNPVYVKSLNVVYERSENIYVLPTFSLNVLKNKKILKPGLVFVDTKTGGVVSLRKVRRFNLMDFYTAFVDLNFLAEHFQPEIYSLVRNVARNNEDFKFKINSPDKLADETFKLVDSVYKLDIETAADFFMNNGIFMGGFRDFREKMDNLFSGTIQELKLKQVGNYKGVMATLGKGKDAVYEFFPVGRVEGELYALSEDMSSKKLSELMQVIHWGDLAGEQQLKTDATSQFIESFGDKKNQTSRKVNQEIYEMYYNVARNLLENSHDLSLGKLEKELQQFLNVLNEYAGKNDRLIQKLSQLLQAIKNKDSRYFNVANKQKKTV